MEAREAELMYRVEMDHWWFVGKRMALAAFLEGLPSPPPGPLLDVGCGAGAVLTELEKHGSAMGLDFLPVCIELSARRGGWPLLRGSADALPVNDGSLGLITCLDVLATDMIDVPRALKEFHRALAPGGYMILFDMAYQGLLSSHDAAFHQTRRVTRPGQIVRVERAGFKVLRATYRNSALSPAIIAARLLRKLADRLRGPDRVEPHSDVDMPPARLNRLLTGLLKAEAGLLARRDMPFGTTVCILARKPA